LTACTVLLSQRADRDRRGFPDEIRVRIRKALLALEADPRPTGTAKLTGERNRWRVRVGDYRILYEVDEGLQRVLVPRIAHRRDVYR
jgi:mRNA interferase RelE/StbE